MPSRTQTTAIRMAGGTIALLIAAALSGVSLPACATDASPVPAFKLPFVSKQNHVHYDVNADGTYKEQDDISLAVLTEQGVQLSRQMPVGMSSMPMPMPMPDREVEVLSAYTLKKSGEHIAATPISSPAPMGMPPGAAPAAGVPQMKFVAFPSVEIGDTLVVSYTVTLKKPLFPGNFVLHQVFSKSMVFEDVVISVTAPAPLNLRAETSGIEPGQRTTAGQQQKWEWKYQNKFPVAFAPNQPPAMVELHVSTYKDNGAEMDAARKLAGAPVDGLAQGCPIVPGIPNDGPDALEAYSAQVANLFWNSEGFLRQVANDWNTPTCMFDDGRLRLTAVPFGLSQAFTDDDKSKSLARLEYLRRKYPKEAIVALAEATFWYHYGWDARGSGYASSVSDEGWKLMKERLEKAESILLDTKPYSSRLPLWYASMISVQTGLGRPEDDRDKVFLEGVKRYPTYYPIYFDMLDYLSPKWGGTWRTVDNLVNWSVEHTKAEEGNSMYARLYWVVSGDPQVNLFKDTFASWPKMKRGFEDLMERHPKSKWNLNNFAKFACLAGDRQIFLKLRAQIGKDVMEGAWEGNPSLDLCETKFGYAE